MVLLVSGYDVSLLQELQEQLLLRNAVVYTPSTYRGEAVDYSVVTIDGKGEITRLAKHHVTHIYIEHCIEAQVACVLHRGAGRLCTASRCR